tara:strand:+ start:253 stop:408 length:156 start_codon:yes stop_codon:yes gene_type:complete
MPNLNISGAVIMVAGRSLSISISSTVKFLVIANRVPTKKAAQMDTVIIAAK